MTCSFFFRGVALLALLAAAALAATPSFYDRRDYGNGNDCAGTADLAIGDINGDGIPDIACGGHQFLFGDGHGGFVLSAAYPVELGGAGLFLLDLNGDGIVDMFSLDMQVPHGPGEPGFKVVFGSGGGHFAAPVFYPVSDENLEYDAMGDFNGDGIPDAVSAGNLGIWLITGKGGGAFNQPVLAVPGSGYYGRIKTADLKGDGTLDIIIGVPTGFAVLFGNGDGTFQPPVTYANPYASCFVTIGDVNSDGYTDVLCASVLNNEAVTIFLGKSGGSFESPYEFAIFNGTDVEVGDVNGDGIPDLVSDAVYVAYGIGNGKFSTPVFFSNAGGANQVVLGHLRSEKRLDAITNDGFTRVSVLLNDGRGGFVDGIHIPFPSGGSCATQADFNGDGIPDIGLVQNETAFTVALGTGAPLEPFRTGPSFEFTDPDTEFGACVSNAADINGDGLPDVILEVPATNNASAINLVPLLGIGGGEFKAAAPINVGSDVSVYLVDVNGDGYADYINIATNQVAYGNGDGTFKAPATFIQADTGNIYYVTWADFNGDGKLDFLVGGEFNTYTMLSQPGGGFQVTLFQGLNVGPYYASTGDLNGDGKPDIVFGSPISEMAVCLNDGDGNFRSAPIYLKAEAHIAAYAPLILDVNEDGLNDIVVGDGGSTAIFTNLGGGKLSAPEYFGEIDNAGVIFLGNWHGQAASDGKPDIFQIYGSGGGVMMLNTAK